MPDTKVYFYRDERGRSPVIEWLQELRACNRGGYAKCVALIRRLKRFGHELRRPHADLLRNGIYELRGDEGRVNYRLLYFFHGRNIAVVAHGLTKVKKVPAAEIDRAIERKNRYEQDPQKHKTQFEIE